MHHTKIKQSSSTNSEDQAPSPKAAQKDIIMHHTKKNFLNSVDQALLLKVAKNEL